MKISSVIMVSGRDGSRGPSNIMKSQFQSQAGFPLKMTENLPAAPYYRMRAGNLWSPGLAAGFVSKILLNTALVHLCTFVCGCFHVATAELSICNRAGWPINPKVDVI